MKKIKKFDSDLYLSEKLYPTYAKFVGYNPEYMKKYLRENRAIILSQECCNAHYDLNDLKALKESNLREAAIQAVNQKITNKSVKLAKKAGKAISLRGFVIIN
jgi:hypothetical protein